MGKKTNKLENLNEIFKASNITINEDQLKTFTNAFELISENKLSEKIQPLNEKVTAYQKRNHELLAKLEEAKNIKPLITENMTKLDEAIKEKVKAINKIELPKSEEITKLIEKKITTVNKNFKSEVKNLNETVNLLEKKLNNITISEDVINLGKTFSHYKTDFVDAITLKESTKIKELQTELTTLKEEVELKTNTINDLEKSLKEEKELSEFATIIENANPDDAEREYLMSFYNKMQFNEAKEAVTQFILMKENKKDNTTKEVSSKFVMKEDKIKRKSNLGIIKERKNEHLSDMDNWVNLANIQGEK